MTAAAAAAVVDGLGWAWKSELQSPKRRYNIPDMSWKLFAVGHGHR